MSSLQRGLPLTTPVTIASPLNSLFMCIFLQKRKYVTHSLTYLLSAFTHKNVSFMVAGIYVWCVHCCIPSLTHSTCSINVRSMNRAGGYECHKEMWRLWDLEKICPPQTIHINTHPHTPSHIHRVVACKPKSLGCQFPSEFINIKKH